MVDVLDRLRPCRPSKSKEHMVDATTQTSSQHDPRNRVLIKKQTMKKSTVILSSIISALLILALPLLTLKLMKYGIEDHIAQVILIVYFLMLAIQCAYTIKWLSQYQKEQEKTNRNGNSMPSKKCYALPDLETIASISIIISKKYAKVIFNTFDMQYKHEADAVIVDLAMGYYLTFKEKGLIPEVNTKARVIHVNNYVEKAIVDLRTEYNEK